jgi:hypothetical protein
MGDSDDDDDDDIVLTPFWWRVLTAIGITFIALGSASEATFLLRDMYVEVYSMVSNQYEYDTLASINVGNTVAYIEDTLGQPRVSRAIDADTTANYFFTGEYLLTLFYNSGRIEAYTWISVDADFRPVVDLRTGESAAMGEFVFADIPLDVNGVALDDSRIVRYYIESLEGGRVGGFVNTYLGNLQYGAFAPADGITDVYQAEVVGDELAAAEALATLRSSGLPNLYGQGNLSIEKIERSVLSNSEFVGYFGNN